VADKNTPRSPTTDCPIFSGNKFMASIQAICLSRFCEAMQGKGILAKETHDNVIRFAPPLVIDNETIDWALPSIRDVLNMNNIRLIV
jgi:acetylornithine/succinyldiaminopimelate/putrescine aminotransferase